MKKNILLISPFFFPEAVSTGKYNTKLVDELVKEGHKLTVICSYPIYPNWKPSEVEFEKNQVKVIRGGFNIRYPKSATLRRFVLESWFAYFVFKNRRIVHNSDIVINVYPPSLYSFFLNLFTKQKVYHIGLIHDLQSIYANNISNPILRKTIGSVINVVEKKIFQKSEKLIFLSKEMMLEAQKHLGLETTNSVYQYPFINLEKTSSDDLSFMNSNKKKIVYSGALGEKQNPFELYKLFDSFSRLNEDFEFFVISGGPIFQELKINNQNPNIKFIDFVPEENLFELYSKSDLQIIPQLPGTSKGSLPSKLPNILFSNTNVLVITDKGSELESLFQQLGLQDHVSTTWEPECLMTKMKLLIQKNRMSIEEEVLVEKFGIKNLVNKILN